MQVFRELDKLYLHFREGPDRLGNLGARRWSGNRTTMMRMDAEVDHNLPYDERVALALRLMEADFIELLYNGDVNITADPLLKSFNGYKVLKERGKEITKFEIASAQLHQEYKPNKRLYEYTLFCVVYVGTKDVSSI